MTHPDDPYGTFDDVAAAEAERKRLCRTMTIDEAYEYQRRRDASDGFAPATEDEAP